ncbi:MAG: hypothetical protein J6C33_04865, partial [Lachnospiraceae bacterium]|nr:hypothetical protein [Lachnospiraceae bacterium]
MMKLSDDFDDRNSGTPLVYMTIGVFLFVVILVGAVVFMNRKPSGNRRDAQNEQPGASAGTDSSETEAGAEEGESDPYISGSKLTSDDLDFWHMYDETESEEEAKAEKQKKEEEETKTDPSTDGKHTKLVAEDGTEEWVSINPYLTKNTYDYSGLVYQYPIMKYYEDSEKVSRVGISVSADDGDVNFNRLKKAGVDFAMIR